MAKEDLQLNITADPEAAIQAMAKIIDKQEVMEKKLKQMNRDGKDTGKMFGELGGILGVGGGIAGGIAFLRSQTQGWSEDVQEVIRKFVDVNKELVKTVSQAGDLANFSEIREALNKISMPGIGPAGRVSMYQALRGELPLESFETIRELLPEAGKAAIFEDPKEFAARMGTTFKLYGGKLKPDDVADTTKIVGDMLGANREKYGAQVFREAERLRAMGMDVDKAVALGIVAAETGQLRGLRSLDTLLTAEKNFERKPGERFTKEQQYEREFFKIEDPMERLNWLKTNRGKGGKAAAVLQDQGTLAVLAEEDIDAVAGRIKKAREVDYFEKTRQIALGTEPGATILGLEKAKAVREETEVGAGEVSAETEIAREMLKTAHLRWLRARIPYLGPLMASSAMYGLSRGWLETEMFLGVGAEGALKTTPLMAGYGPVPGAIQPQEVKQAFTKEIIDDKTTQELTKALKDLTKVLTNKNKDGRFIYSDSGLVD